MRSVMDGRALRRELRERIAKLASEVDATRRDRGFQEALRVMALFWRYSVFNQYVILLQRPDATREAGRKTWGALGRQVKEGERPIEVLAPVRGGAAYVAVPVYDERQTRGRRLPKLQVTLSGGSRHVRGLERAAQRLGVEVAYRPQAFGAEASSRGGRIEIEPGLPAKERVSVLAHELAHEILHQAERRADLERNRPPPQRTRAETETEAEATAHVVLAALGIRSASPTYIAWQGGNGAAVLRSMSRVQRAAKAILVASGLLAAV